MELTNDMFSHINALIIGDVMIDQYMIGKVYRQSPEANIPVLEDVEISSKLGGAANVAMNLVNLGAKTSLLAVTGTDEASAKMSGLLEENKIDATLIRDHSRKTTVKTRVFVDNQQIVRVDQEDKHALGSKTNQNLLNALTEIIATKSIDIIILQDYNKGVLHAQNIEKIIAIARSAGIFVAVDPKFDNFRLYKGVNLLKPNLKELIAQGDNSNNYEPFSVSEISELAEKIRQDLSAETILVTLSEHGAMICEEKDTEYHKADPIEVVDVCGAGDAVMAVISLLKIVGVDNKTILKLTNKTGKIVCGKTGVSSVSITELSTK